MIVDTKEQYRVVYNCRGRVTLRLISEHTMETLDEAIAEFKAVEQASSAGVLAVEIQHRDEYGAWRTV